MGAGLVGAECDLGASAGVGGIGGKACHAKQERAGVGVEDRKEGAGSEFNLRHFFASLEMRLGGEVGACQEGIWAPRKGRANRTTSLRTARAAPVAEA